MKFLSQFSFQEKNPAQFIFGGEKATRNGRPERIESLSEETSHSLRDLEQEMADADPTQNPRLQTKKLVFRGGRLVLQEIKPTPKETVVPVPKKTVTEESPPPKKPVEIKKTEPTEVKPEKKDEKEKPKKLVFRDGKLVLLETEPKEPYKTRSISVKEEEEEEEETSAPKKPEPEKQDPRPIPKPKKKTEAPPELTQTGSLTVHDFDPEHVLAGEDGHSFVLQNTGSLKLRDILPPGKTFYLRSQGKDEKITWGMSNEGRNDYIDSTGNRVPIYNKDLIVTVELFDLLKAQLEHEQKTAEKEGRPTRADIEDLNPEDLNQSHIIMREDGNSFELQDVGSIKLRDIMEPGKTFYIQSKGNVEKITWGMSTEGRNDYIDSNKKRVKIYDGDLIFKKEFYEEIKEHPSSQQEDVDLTRKGLRSMPREQILGAQKVPDLSDQEVSSDTAYLLALFPKDFHWGLIRLSKNLKSRGIDLTLDNPITVNSVRQQMGATYDPRTKSVFTFKIITGTGGAGNGFNEKATPLGSSQVGAINYAGQNGNASFGGNQATLKGTNIESLGLDKKSRTSLFRRGTSAEKVYDRHSLSSAMGNSNSQSVTSYSGAVGTPRGTSNHGVDGWRVEGGRTHGCIGMDQVTAKRQAEIYLTARNSGHPAFIENQYDGRKVIPYMDVYRSHKSKPRSPLAKLADIIIGKKKLKIPDSIVALNATYEPKFKEEKLKALRVNKPATETEKEAYLDVQRLFGPGFYPHSSSGHYDNPSSKVNTTFLNTKPSTVAGMQIFMQKLVALNDGEAIDIVLTGGDEVGHSGWKSPGNTKSGKGKLTHWEGDKVDIRSSSKAGQLIWSLVGEKSYKEIDIGDYRFKILRHGASTNSDHFDVAVTYKPGRKKLEQFNYQSMLTIAEAQRQGLAGVRLMRLKRELSLLLLNPDAKKWSVEEFDNYCTKVRKKWQGIQ